jgi:hypothetical protein
MKNLVMPYTESGITIDLPNDVEFFCFENCNGYRMLSGNHFKEMDIGWYDSSENILYLIELKDFTKKNLRDRNIAKQVVFDLVKKSVDSMAMIMAVKAGTHYSSKIQPCLPPSFNVSTSKIKMIHIINCSEDRKTDIQFLRDKFQEHFEAYKKLFDVENCTVVSVQQARKFLSPVK